VFEFAWYRSDVVLKRHLDHSPCSTSCSNPAKETESAARP
jgi:hypothetical protein